MGAEIVVVLSRASGSMSGVWPVNRIIFSASDMFLFSTPLAHQKRRQCQMKGNNLFHHFLSILITAEACVWVPFFTGYTTHSTEKDEDVWAVGGRRKLSVNK